MATSQKMIERIQTAKFQLMIAEENARRDHGPALMVSVNNLQDAVEIFLIGIAEHLNISLEERATFDKYFQKIDDKLASIPNVLTKELPFKVKLLALNRARVGSKHAGNRPDYNDLQTFLVVVREFFEEVCRFLLNVDFSSVSIIDVINDQSIRKLLQDARQFLENNDAVNCLVECRKAIYILFEKGSDISIFLSGRSLFGLSVYGCEAPYFAQNDDYINKHVHTPFDYIVLDHRALEMKLLTIGVSPDTMRSILSMTPRVYFFDTSETWVYEEDYAKLQGDDLLQRAEIVFNNVMEIIIRRDQHEIRHPKFRSGRGRNMRLPHNSITVYKKADRTSIVVGRLPSGLGNILVFRKTPSLDGSEYFYSVSHFIEGGDGILSGTDLSGFIAISDIEIVDSVPR